ncbi:heme-binding protein [Candidatus Nitrospira neomarina]|uniref:Heme-binding protein n=1 Tax=Candidatus Nitrospira neomarina TaxID=3020899 RepID=A0AA96GPD5_9BACT|nr:heme-binding protein [Candidatus Nitrospira neomarina]WNM64135.1 heme-binding protein [Candidatus Nitrospira neomarina]
MNRFMLTSISLASGIILSFGQTAADAQVSDKRTLTLAGAHTVMNGAVEAAKKMNAPGGSIAIVDDGGNLLCLERLDGTFAASSNIAIGKARTAALFKKPTKIFGEAINKGRTTMVSLNDFTPLQGGVPIQWEGTVIGAIGVSGAASAQQDEELAMAGAEALDGMSPSLTPASQLLPVTFIASHEVHKAFSKGAVLVGKEETMMHADRNYMVHASHREKAGMAEIHELDTDIVYVLQGTATLVTGGQAIDAKITAPHELRGSSIEGGETRHLVAGDVIVIPHGVPHWFQEVQAPFDYYVVKVR